MSGYQEPKGRRRDAVPGSRGRTRDVRRPWKIGKANSKSRPHLVRWVVAGEVIVTTFATRPLADGFRSRLMHAMDVGEEFDVATGFPVSMLPAKAGKNWLTFSTAYMAARWDNAAAKTRDSIADSLATTALAMVKKGANCPANRDLRRAFTWAILPANADAEPPETAGSSGTQLDRADENRSVNQPR